MKSIIQKKISTQFFFASFIVSVSGLWMTAVTPLSPFYLCVLPIMFYPFYFNYKIHRNDYTTKAVYFFCAIFSLYIIFQPAVTDSTIHNNFVLAFCLFFYVFVDSILYNIDLKKDYEKIIKMFCSITVCYMVVDFIKRYTATDFENVPTWIEANPIFRFYLLKGIGLHGDSNNSAAISLTALCLCFYYNKILAEKKLHFLLFALIICTILTCSRAAILSFVVLLLFFHLFYKQNIYVKVLDVFGILGIGFLLVYFLMNDPSGNTKIAIFQKTWKYFWEESNPVKFLFGYGGNNSKIVLGRYAHNPISVYFIEYGFIGLIFYFSLFISISLDVGYLSLFILVPYLLFSLSFSPLHTTYVFTALSLVKHSKRIYGTKK